MLSSPIPLNAPVSGQPNAQQGAEIAGAPAEGAILGPGKGPDRDFGVLFDQLGKPEVNGDLTRDELPNDAATTSEGEVEAEKTATGSAGNESDQTAENATLEAEPEVRLAEKAVPLKGGGLGIVEPPKVSGAVQPPTAEKEGDTAETLQKAPETVHIAEPPKNAVQTHGTSVSVTARDTATAEGEPRVAQPPSGSPVDAKGLAHVARTAGGSVQDTVAAQQFGLQVAGLAREVRTASQQAPQTKPLDLPRNARAELQSASVRGASRGETPRSSQASLPVPITPSPPQVAPPVQAAPKAAGQVTPATGANLILSSLGEQVQLLQTAGDAPVEMTWEAARSQTTAATPAIMRPETPVHVARQMAEALQRMPDKPVELTLNPEELGRVRLSISAAELGITVNILAERVETLELMRRHIDQLAEQFQNMGYENIAFSFGEGSQSSESGGTDDQESTELTPHEPIVHADTPQIHASLSLGTGGLDIRL